MFLCAYCLEVIETERQPDICQHCKVGFCQTCSSKIKADQKWCNGCGRLYPIIKSKMCRASSTGSVYITQNWMTDGLMPKGQDFFYGISSGVPDEEDKEKGKLANVNLVKYYINDNRRENVRKLTTIEYKHLGYGFSEQTCPICGAKDDEPFMDYHICHNCGTEFEGQETSCRTHEYLKKAYEDYGSIPWNHDGMPLWIRNMIAREQAGVITPDIVFEEPPCNCQFLYGNHDEDCELGIDCPECNGLGEIRKTQTEEDKRIHSLNYDECKACDGSGRIYMKNKNKLDTEGIA